MANGATNSTLAQYLGELFQTSQKPNTLLRLLGGLHGAVQTVTGIEFPVGVFYNLRAAAQPARLEGAAAPTAEHRPFTQATNVVQIFHEQVGATYLGQSDNTLSGPVAIPIGGAQGSPKNPRDPAVQAMLAVETIAQDMNYSFLRGAYAKPADPTATALRTRGLLTAITTNISDKSAVAIDATDPQKQYRGFVEGLLRTQIQANGYNPDSTWVIMGDAMQYGNIIAAYEALPSNKAPESREVLGQKIRTIYTRYGVLMVVMEPDMPADTVAILNVGVAGIVCLPVPSKGMLFEEPIAKDGSSDKTQIYGQFGVDHGPEWAHGKLVLPAGFDLSN